MARVTAWLAALSLAAGVVTFVVGVRAGYGTSPVSSHLNWGAATLVLQLFTAGVAAVHARVAARQAAELRAAAGEGAETEPPPAPR
jgi:hypothetical protein